MPLAGGFIDQFNADVATLADKTKTAFETAIGQQLIPRATKLTEAGASSAWREETSNAPMFVARRARFFDLVVLAARSGKSTGRIRTRLSKHSFIPVARFWWHRPSRL